MQQAEALDDLVRILIVEDRGETARRFAEVLAKEPRFAVCAVAGSVAAAIAGLRDHCPRIVLVDLGLPDGSGIDVIRAVRAAPFLCECLVISVFGEEHRVLEAISAGARGYILKSERVDEIARNVHELLDGGSPISPQIARQLLSLLPQGQDDKPGYEPQLTQREREILMLIARGYKRHEVAARLNIAIGTVGTHIHSIYRKLNVRTNVEAVAIAKRYRLL